MKYVIDASALVSALVDTGPDGQWAEQLLANGALCGPQILPIETANILRRAELSGDIDTTTAGMAHQAMRALTITLFEYGPLANRVWSLRHNLTVYDATYVALAEALECELATLDFKLAASTGPHCRFLMPPRSRVNEQADD